MFMVTPRPRALNVETDAPTKLRVLIVPVGPICVLSSCIVTPAIPVAVVPTPTDEVPYAMISTIAPAIAGVVRTTLVPSSAVNSFGDPPFASARSLTPLTKTSTKPGVYDTPDEKVVCPSAAENIYSSLTAGRVNH